VLVALVRTGVCCCAAEQADEADEALAWASRDTEEGYSACPPLGGHRALTAHPRCWTDLMRGREDG